MNVEGRGEERRFIGNAFGVLLKQRICCVLDSRAVFTGTISQG